MDGDNEVDVDEVTPQMNKPKTKRMRKNSWSDDDSESDSVIDEGNELDSDSDHGGSDDSLSDDEQNLRDKAKPNTQPSPTKMSPPRLLGGPPLRKRGSKPKRSRQIKLSFASADDTPVKSKSTKIDAASAVSVSQDSATTANVSAPQQIGPVLVHRNDDISTSRIVLQSSVFFPAVYPSGYKPTDTSEQEFEYVMALITTRPLGIGVTSNKGPGIFLLAPNTSSPAVLEAINQGVIKNGDEIFAINEQVLRNTTVKNFKEIIVPALSLPARCWFRTKRKSKVFPAASSSAISAGVETSARSMTVKVASNKLNVASIVTSTPPESRQAATQSIQNARGDDGVVSLGIDWPWVFLRSDGKLAMNLFWKSLDSAFFVRKINKRTFSQLQEKVEDMSGVRLTSSHPEYQQVRELLVMPRRERVPAFIVEFRRTRQQKQKFLSSDIIMGASSEPKDSELKVDEQTALAVGTTVTVAKRTWPGMNKLGGVGRIKKVNDETLSSGTKRFTYNIAYVVAGGFEKNVERKYISVVDLDAEEAEKNEGNSSTIASRRQKVEPEPDSNDSDETDASTLSVRLAFTMSRTGDEELQTALPDAGVVHPPKKRRFQLQFSTANATVHCERKSDIRIAVSHEPEDAIPVKELLLHRHFDVKLPKHEVLINACFSSELLRVEDRVGDEVDEDDTDSETEADEIKTELETLQTQFRAVMEANELAFASLTSKVEEEYASKGYRQQELQDIQWRNYERMYQELQTAKQLFDDSDDGSDSDIEGSAAGNKAGSEEEQESEPEDVSFGGMFVNKLKQEGSEVCTLCELSGGDFTGTDTGSVVHPQCAMFTPETFFKDGVVHGIDLVDPERRRLKCSICGGKKGLSKIQCAHRKCVQAFHVACAFVNGLLTSDPYYQAWCPRHLKTSGMGQFVELPDHLTKHAQSSNSNDTPSATPASSPARRNRKGSKQRSSRQKRGRNRQDSTPAEATTATRADISSSKTNRKRKRKGSNASMPANGTTTKSAARASRGSSPRSAIDIEEQEPRCARRLDIDELSDDSDHEGKAVEAWQQDRDTQRIFVKNDVVEVLAREWPGMNKPGGVARVRAVELVPNKHGGKDVFYDVNYVLGTYKEKRVPARFVRSYIESTSE
ncbi:unnamed protein product [Phytophthora fragariaefolia]|uniref:Unnamed protein product n=1 Tax=Phytophthora fragariaefolia TaxID=1490495 RepID=A0A9W6X1Y8_9STRA|nr:unnamed protein product [Phytophthora fragariaefolia]